MEQKQIKHFACQINQLIENCPNRQTLEAILIIVLKSLMKGELPAEEEINFWADSINQKVPNEKH